MPCFALNGAEQTGCEPKWRVNPGPWRQKALLGRARWDAGAPCDLVRDYGHEHQGRAVCCELADFDATEYDGSRSILPCNTISESSLPFWLVSMQPIRSAFCAMASAQRIISRQT
jgi:hypothetical protein